MSFDADISKRLHRALGCGEDFFLFRAPGGEPRLIDRAAVVCTPWPGEMPSARVWTESTGRDQYLQRVGALVERLGQRGGKTVISTVIAAHLPDVDMVALASDYFDANPQAYCTFFVDSRHGGWLGASPELLFSLDGSRLQTMALAGTRQAGMSDPWDKKNIEEHRMVADFVEVCLDKCTARYKRHELSELRSGHISHLLTAFEADTPDDLDRFKDMMFPTPAVGGLPRDRALADIAAVEDHPRKLYAGLIDLTDPVDGRRYCIVNLRCMNFVITSQEQDCQSRYSADCCIYAGGGITADSDPESEWAETRQKSAWLASRLTAHSDSY